VFPDRNPPYPWPTPGAGSRNGQTRGPVATAPVCRDDVIVDVIVDESVEVIVDGRLQVFADENAEPYLE
jgi:hypothetical protein